MSHEEFHDLDRVRGFLDGDGVNVQKFSNSRDNGNQLSGRSKWAEGWAPLPAR